MSGVKCKERLPGTDCVVRRKRSDPVTKGAVLKRQTIKVKIPGESYRKSGLVRGHWKAPARWIPKHFQAVEMINGETVQYNVYNFSWDDWGQHVVADVLVFRTPGGICLFEIYIRQGMPLDRALFEMELPASDLDGTNIPNTNLYVKINPLTEELED